MRCSLEGNDDGLGSEGAVSGKVVGTYLHGPVLARNADFRRGPVVGVGSRIESASSRRRRSRRIATRAIHLGIQRWLPSKTWKTRSLHSKGCPKFARALAKYPELDQKRPKAPPRWGLWDQKAGPGDRRAPGVSAKSLSAALAERSSNHNKDQLSVRFTLP